MSVNRKSKLELTWTRLCQGATARRVGKENRPRLELRILREDPERSYHAKHRVSGKNSFDNRLIFAINLPVPHLAKFSRERHLLSSSGFRIAINNTRAVPLARKGDAHQGRVFYCTQSTPEACSS